MPEETRCAVTELPVDGCAHCRPAQDRPDPADDPARGRLAGEDFGPVFFARFDGRCFDCGDTYDAGERIAAWSGGGYVHEDCVG